MKSPISLIAILLFLFQTVAITNAQSPEAANPQVPELEQEFWSAYAKSDFEKASEISEKLIDTIPDYLMLSAISDFNLYKYASYKAKMDSYHRMKNWDYTSLRVLLEKHYIRNRHEVNNLMGMVQFMIPKVGLGSAKEFFERSIKIEQYNPIAFNFLAISLMQEGDFDGAIKNAEISISMNPEYPEPYGALAFAWYRKGDEQKAMDKLLEGMVTCPVNSNDTYANFLRITCNTTTLASGDTTVSVPTFKTETYRDYTMDKLKGYSRPLYELAFQFYLFQSYSEADFVLDAIEVDPDIRTKYYYLRALNAFAAGDTAGFDEIIETLVLLEESPTLLDVGSNFYQKENYALALSVLQLAEPLPSSDETSMKVLSNIGALNSKLGNNEDAIKYFKKALKKDKTDVLTLINMGIAYHRLDKGNKARKALMKAGKYDVSDRQARTINHWLNEIEKAGE